MMEKSDIKAKLKIAIGTLAIPVLTWLIMDVIDRQVAGVGVISNMTDVKGLLRTVLTSFSFALALNCNLTSGRMDLSAGAQMYMGCIFGGNIALILGWGGVGVLIISMLIGALCGLIVGVVFVNLRILPMVLGIGMTLVFECISFSAYSQQGLMLFGKSGVAILSDIRFILVVAVLLIMAITYFFQLSEYGYKRKAIQGSQKLASDSGINVFKNCIWCYTLAGGLVACAGVFDTAYAGTLTPVLGMNSNASVFSNMFPLFLGMTIGSFSGNPIIGVFMGSMSVKILTMGLAKLGMTGSTQKIIIYALFLVFQIYRANAYRIQHAKLKNVRIRLAKETRKEKEAQAV